MSEAGIHKECSHKTSSGGSPVAQRGLCCVPEAVDGSMDALDAAVAVDSVSASVHCGGADQASAAGDEGAEHSSLEGEDDAIAATPRDENIIGAVDTGEMKRPTSAAIADSGGDAVQSADTAAANCRRMESGDSVDQSAKDSESHDREGDGESTNERACLEAMTPVCQDFYLRLGDTPRRRSALRLSRIIARQQLLRKLEQEIEAKEACDWLRAAGFPQYAQLYEDSQFPVDISSVKRDHDFLDRDLVEPLCRRLNTLNKCASMKLDVSHPRKKGDDSDEDDPLAISKRWTFEWSSRRWSRLQDFLLDSTNENSPTGQGGGLRSTVSSESVLTDLSEQEITDISSLHSEDSTSAMPDSISMASLSASYQPPSELSHYNSLPMKSSRHGQGGRSKAKEFLRRMEGMRTWGPSTRRKSSNRRPPLVISGPVLQGEEPLALQVLQCTPISQLEPSPNNHQTDEDTPADTLTNDCKEQSLVRVSASSEAVTPDVKEPGFTKPRPASKRSSMYLEDMDLPSQGKRTEGQSQFGRNQFHSHENLLIHIPKDHKPGTFPKALSIESLAPSPDDRNNGRQTRTQPSTPCNGLGDPWSNKPLSRPPCPGAPRGSRVSVYDNVPGSHLYASTGDLQDLENEDNMFPHLDDIIQHVSGLQQIVDHWSRSVLPEDDAGEEEGEGRTTPSECERDGVSMNDTDSTGTSRERRDSGVGASLTRPRLRWPSFRTSDHLNQPASSLQISSQSAGQLSLLQKFSLLRLTAIMEKYSMSNKHGWTWSVPKFMKRIKVPDYKEKSVFGVPLIVHVQRCGFPLPLCLQQALSHLRTHCLDQVGLFRKSGVKSRILALRQQCELSPDSVSYEDQSAYDVADMVKQFFRDLPEPLLTSKLGETFLHIYQYVPKEQRMQAVRAAILLMPDENREVLQTLLSFLRDVTALVEENQMTPMNLAVCLGPSLFHLSILKNETLSPRSIQKKYTTGRPDQKDLSENLAATQGLAHMISESHRLFQIPEEMVTQSRNSYMEAELMVPPLDELCKAHEEEVDEDEEEDDEEGSYHGHIEGLVQNLLKDAKDKSKAWVSRSTIDNTELAFRKVGDGNPLRQWRVCVEVPATPNEVLHRLLRERPLWQTELQQEKVLEPLDRQTDVYQYSCCNMEPQPNCDYVVLRSWRTELCRGSCALVSVSVEHEDSPRMGGLRGVVLESQYLLEPCGTERTRLTHISRVDLRGRSPEWYNKAFGHLCVNEVQRIRSSFLPPDQTSTEAKV
ncbi:stAR-related lipid transfer protein 13 isoform X2 [Platichthys flesus]|uniref:stAR-related lipid transfer protein 13 isoform X2 n=1 Tax=Platichthys flesus TaxID=8260 RepID=UPI002DBEB108|nr:stAR-related lipid transfer protein 13 isoform X2 [Platichthys flesus]